MIYLFAFQHAVVVKFHRNDCLVRQYRACVIDSLELELHASYITVLCVHLFLDLATARATSVVLSVRVCVQRHTNS